MFKYLSVVAAMWLVQVYAAERSSICREHNGYYPIEGNCNAFIKCKDYIANVMLCPDGLHYNPRVVWPEYPCGYPTDVPCQGRDVPSYALFQSSGFQNTRQQSNFGSQAQQGQQNQYQQNQYQQQQSQQNQYQHQQAAPRQSAGSCKELNERSPVAGSCDKYIECINGTAEEKQCPDGLRYNPNLNTTVYPCQYPNEYSCLEHSALQPPQPTDDCPNQFGYFKLGDAKNCSSFRNCLNGVGYDFTCPEGLAWSSVSYRCEWPDEVEDCDAEAFLGFRCPEVPVSREHEPPAGYRFYRSDSDCQKYFMCIENNPRVLRCDGDTAFDDLTSTCVYADEVEACPSELRAAAARARNEEIHRLATRLQRNEINALPVQFTKRG